MVLPTVLDMNIMFSYLVPRALVGMNHSPVSRANPLPSFLLTISWCTALVQPTATASLAATFTHVRLIVLCVLCVCVCHIMIDVFFAWQW